MIKRGKNAQAGIITSMLIIVLTLTLVVVMWNIVNILVTNSAKKVDINAYTVKLDILEAKLYATGGAKVQVQRGAGGDKITDLGFLFQKKNGEVKTITRTTNLPDEVDTKTYYFSPSETALLFNNTDIAKISLVPGFEANSGIKVDEEQVLTNSFGDRILDLPNPAIPEEKQIMQESGVVSWWKFDGDYKDSVTGSIGTQISTVNFVSEKNNKAVSFSQSGYVQINDIVTPPYPYKLNSPNYISVSLWLYMDSSDTDGGLIISKPWNNFGEYNYRIYLPDSSTNLMVRLLKNTGTGYTIIDRTVNVPKNSWHHVVFSVDSVNLDIYVDGVKTSSAHGITNWNPFSGDLNNALTIGYIYPYGSPPTQTNLAIIGKIDDLMIFNKAISSADVQALYNAQK